MNKAAVLNQIVAVRVMLDNIEAEIQKEKDTPDKPLCDHREVRNLTTMGGPEEWICQNPSCNLHYKEERIDQL